MGLYANNPFTGEISFKETQITEMLIVATFINKLFSISFSLPGKKFNSEAGKGQRYRKIYPLPLGICDSGRRSWEKGEAGNLSFPSQGQRCKG